MVGCRFRWKGKSLGTQHRRQRTCKKQARAAFVEGDACQRPAVLAVERVVGHEQVRFCDLVVALERAAQAGSDKRGTGRGAAAGEVEVEVVKPEGAAVGEDERVRDEQQALARLQGQQGRG